MNIFLLDSDITTCASYYIDRHVVKIRAEIVQMLSLAHKKGAYYNHPMSIWVRDTTFNYNWAAQLGLALCKEKDFRYGEKPQKCLTSIKNLLKLSVSHPNTGVPFPQCMPEHIRCDDPIEAYRRYYIECKSTDKNGNRMDKWTKRERPAWYI